jgi:hypothetical protein
MAKYKKNKQDQQPLSQATFLKAGWDPCTFPPFDSSLSSSVKKFIQHHCLCNSHYPSKNHKNFVKQVDSVDPTPRNTIQSSRDSNHQTPSNYLGPVYWCPEMELLFPPSQSNEPFQMNIDQGLIAENELGIAT